MVLILRRIVLPMYIIFSYLLTFKTKIMKSIFTLFLILASYGLYAQCDFTINTTIVEPTCFGEASGFIELEATGGTPPYNYDWFNGVAGPALNGLPAGCYIAYVTDDTGCTSSIETCLAEPTQLFAIADPGGVFCSGEFADVWVTVTGGIPPYVYQWENGATTSVVQLPAGAWDVTVTDANACIVTAVTEITEPLEMQLSTIITPPSCDGTDLGSVEIVASGGTAPYEFILDGVLAGTIPMFDGLEPGTHEVFVIDVNGCTATVTFVIAPSLYYEVFTSPASCGVADGTAEINIINSVSGNLEYAWSTGGTGPTETGLAQGWYSVTVTETTEPCTIHVNYYIDEDLSCKVVLGGYVYNDNVNPDCTNDTDTEALGNIMVILDNGLATFTDNTGYYEFVLDNGTYQLEFVPGYQYAPLCPASGQLSVSLPNDGMVSTDNDFYVEYSDYQDICIGTYSGPARPGFVMQNSVLVCNNGGATIDNGVLTFVHDTILTGTYTSPAANNYDPTSYQYEWEYSGLEPGDCIEFMIYGTIPVGTSLGTLVNSSAAAGPIADDINPENNSSEWHQIVTGSYDPNDKRGFIGDADEWGGDILEEDTWFNYNLRFQNVGTDTAFTVVVRDTLDLNVFDITSIEVGPSSHPYSLQFEDDNVLVFWFENIDLVDSTTNEPGSNGFASFSISRFPDLPIGTEIKNSAAIYFDFNAPVITNTTVHTISNPVNTSNLQPKIEANIYPNPITDETIVSYQLEKTERLSISIIDQLGRTCFSLLENEVQTAGNYTIPMDGKDLSPGIYLLQITTQHGQMSRKFIK